MDFAGSSARICRSPTTLTSSSEHLLDWASDDMQAQGKGFLPVFDAAGAQMNYIEILPKADKISDEFIVVIVREARR